MPEVLLRCDYRNCWKYEFLFLVSSFRLTQSNHVIFNASFLFECYSVKIFHFNTLFSITINLFLNNNLYILNLLFVFFFGISRA